MRKKYILRNMLGILIGSAALCLAMGVPGYARPTMGSSTAEETVEWELSAETEEEIEQLKPVTWIHVEGCNGVKLQNMIHRSSHKGKVQIVEQADEGTEFIYDGGVKVELQVSCEDFDERNMQLLISKNGELMEEAQPEIQWETTEETQQKILWETAQEAQPITEEGDLKTPMEEGSEVSQKVTHRGYFLLEEDGTYEVVISWNQTHWWQRLLDRSQEMIFMSDEYEGKEEPGGYHSNRITIDSTSPVLSISRKEESAIDGEMDGGFYTRGFDAVLMVRDENLQPENLQLSLRVQDVTGRVMKTMDYESYIHDWKHWIETADGYQLTLPIWMEGNYELTLECEDLAHNSSNTIDKAFGIDGTAPKNIMIEPESCVEAVEQRDENIYYYRDNCRVKIGVQEEMSGLERMLITWEGQEQNAANSILRKEISKEDCIQEGNYFYTEIGIPEVFGTANMNSRGNLHVTIWDQAGNKVSGAYDGILVLDSSSPVRTVEFPSPAYKEDGISYYPKQAEIRIRINEDHFYPEDVQVRLLTEEGMDVPTLSWSEQKGGFYEGYMSVDQEGSYSLSVSYHDKSGNEMEPYLSEPFVVDCMAPLIRVSDIKPNSAVKSPVFGLKLQIEEIADWLDLTSIDASLTLLTRNQDGEFVRKNVDLGPLSYMEVKGVVGFEIENLKEDGLYILSCQASDKAGNSSSDIRLDDGQMHAVVCFSINRQGSVFTMDSYTERIAECSYIQSLKQDLVLQEINVDPIREYTVYLNGEELDISQYETWEELDKNHWCSRYYRLPKVLFTREGEYQIVVSSRDKADTIAYSDLKDARLVFTVDHTAPVLIVEGLNSQDEYSWSTDNLRMLPGDAGGRLRGIKIWLFQDKMTSGMNASDIELAESEMGEPIWELNNDRSNELEQYLIEKDGILNIDVQKANTVCIQMEDYAGNRLEKICYRGKAPMLSGIGADPVCVLISHERIFYLMIFLCISGLVTVGLILYRKYLADED